MSSENAIDLAGVVVLIAGATGGVGTVAVPGNRALQPKADYSSWPAAEDVAQVILFLCSPRASAVSGALVPVYGRS